MIHVKRAGHQTSGLVVSPCSETPLLHGFMPFPGEVSAILQSTEEGFKHPRQGATVIILQPSFLF